MSITCSVETLLLTDTTSDESINKDSIDSDYLGTVLMISITEAKILFQKGNLEEATNLFKEIYKHNDLLPTLNYSLALISLGNNDLESAQVHIKKEMEITYNSIKVKTLRYIIHKKLGTSSSWEAIHFNIIKKSNPNTYKLFDSALLLKQYDLIKESNDMFNYAKQLNASLFKELVEKNNLNTLTSISSEDNSTLV